MQYLPRGLKPRDFSRFAARLKSCPDTEPHSDVGPRYEAAGTSSNKSCSSLRHLRTAVSDATSANRPFTSTDSCQSHRGGVGSVGSESFRDMRGGRTKTRSVMSCTGPLVCSLSFVSRNSGPTVMVRLFSSDGPSSNLTVVDLPKLHDLRVWRLQRPKFRE